MRTAIFCQHVINRHLVYLPLMDAGFEKRGEIIRLVQTLRGGDRPKNAHDEFGGVSVMPRSGWEPWGLFRKPCEGRVQDNLRRWRTGGLRRISPADPFSDVVRSSPTRGEERKIAPHPSLKPQAFMRQIVRAALPLGEGVILDPFMGAGSTIAAAAAVGYASIGIENDATYFKIARNAIPALAKLTIRGASSDNGSSGGNGADWKYETSRASAEGGGRTHTFGVKMPAKRLLGAAAFVLPGVALRNGRPVLVGDTDEAI